MKKILLTLLAITGLSLGNLATIQAAIIEDNYKGPSVVLSNGTTYDVDSFDHASSGIKNDSHNRFDLYGYSYNSIGSFLEITIYSRQLSYFDIGIHSYGLGDLFIATHYTDAELIGFDGWNYAVDLGYKSGQPLDLYSLDQGAVTPGIYREPFVLFTPTVLGSGTHIGEWFIINNSIGNSLETSTWDTLTLTMDLTTIWDGTSNLLMQFTQVCGNDILRMQVTGAPVPEPSTLLLFGSGLLGFAGLARRRNNS